MNILNIFGWGDNAGDGGQIPDSRWEEFPDAVKMNVLQFMDKEPLNHMSEAFPSARRLVENNFGTKVVIPARNWNLGGKVLSMFTPFQHAPKCISDNYIAKLVTQVEGKKIRDLEMHEMPGVCEHFTFDKFITFPRYLKHVRLKYCDVQLIHDLLTKCHNLESFHYQTGFLRHLPYGTFSMLTTQMVFASDTVPTYGDDFILKINPFQNFQLNNLKEISLKMEYMLTYLKTDWHNVIYILLRLPPLPSVTRFNFEFNPKSEQLTWKTHLIILGCLADFLLKLPNLIHFQYHSTFNSDPKHDQSPVPYWGSDMLSGLIFRFGSNNLKIMYANRSEVIHPFLDSLRQTMNLAAGSLNRLESLDLKLGEAKEHRVFRDFILLLPSRVTNVHVTNLSKEIFELNMGPVNVYSVFAFPHENPIRLPMFNSITILTVHCTKALIQRTSLTRILEALPQLIEVQFKGPSPTVACFLDLEDRIANPGIFTRLQKLSVENICLAFQVPQEQDPSRQSLVLCRFKNLKELRLQSSYFGYGIRVVDLIEIFGSLRKLSKVHVKPLVFYPFTGQLHPNGRGLVTLENIGFLKTCGPDVVDRHVLRVYDFIFNEV